MNETQRRIKAYKAALPGLKERVFAVAIMLAMSVAMMTSATFAWLTISRRPEVSEINTNVAANGNLEIALVAGDGKTAPDESKLGDSSASEGQTLSGANVTWGNLVNLSDPVYGLEHLTLRPALLNTSALLTSPLYGAMFGEDGRITQVTSRFGYATWDPTAIPEPGQFVISDKLGVRAISSTKLDAAGPAKIYNDQVEKARSINVEAGMLYTGLADKKDCMNSLATMMGTYMTARMNSGDASLSNPTCESKDIANLAEMYRIFLQAMDKEAEAIAEQVNLQLLIKNNMDWAKFEKWDQNKVMATTSADLKNAGVTITGFDQFKKDYATIQKGYGQLTELSTQGEVAWVDSGLNGIVNELVEVGLCTVDGTPINSIGTSNAAGYLNGTHTAVINKSILLRFEERTGATIYVENLKITATIKRYNITVPGTVTANVMTANRENKVNNFEKDLAAIEATNTGDYAGQAVAKDTYGMVIDMWVRTNATGSILTLEGNVLVTKDSVRATGLDATGNIVELYTVTVKQMDASGEETNVNIPLYPVVIQDENGSDVTTWYHAETHSMMTAEDMGNATPIPWMQEVETVVGYEGENRVWGDNNTLTVDSTTQGNGSCYVYYADTPEDQARSLKLLSAFNVAFIDDKGQLLATAQMDTEHHYAENGRVTVPLKVTASDSVIGKDEDNNPIYGIMPMEKNVATRLSAIVYLDGSKLTNKEVLAASDIQGQLNIQFGNTNELTAADNEDLFNKELSVSATVDNTRFDYDTHTGDMISTVTVTVDGDPPSAITGFFLRAISDTQGSREKEMEFKENEDGKWVAQMKFTTPGEYVLRTIQLDGVDYDLAEPLKVTVTGFAVKSLSCSAATNNRINIMSADSAATVQMNLQFAADDVEKLPKTVQARFMTTDGVTADINFKMNSSGIWSGETTFRKSGDYTLQTLILDGEYMPLDAAHHYSAHVVLGLRVTVYTSSPQRIKYVPSEMTEDEKNLKMKVTITDNSGKEMQGLSDVKLTYGMQGSSVRTMDTDLHWNGQHYVGELHNEGPGIWKFSNVVVGSNVLSSATSSPTFTVLSPEPPQFYSNTSEDYQYAPNKDATMSVVLTNAGAVSIQATMVNTKTGEESTKTFDLNLGDANKDGVTYSEYTTADGKEATKWIFPVPTNTAGYQDGNWQLTKLTLWDVYDANGTEYTEEAPLVFDTSVIGTDNKTKVVSQVVVTFNDDRFAGNKAYHFGKKNGEENGTLEGEFMETYEITGLSVSFTDFEGQPLTYEDANGNTVSLISDVSLEYQFRPETSSTYGGYTSSEWDMNSQYYHVTVPLGTRTDTTFAQSGTGSLQFAGTYYTTLTYEVNGVPVTHSDNTTANPNAASLPANTPRFTVNSVAPTVTITGISPQGSHTTAVQSGNTPVQKTVTSSLNGNTATVYCGATVKTESGCTGTTYSIDVSTYPRVTINLSGYGNASQASLVFSGTSDEIYMYTGEGSGQTSAYTWSANGDCTRYFGKFESGTCSSDSMNAAGTLTANQIVLTDANGNEYIVTISTITINNPAS